MIPHLHRVVTFQKSGGGWRLPGASAGPNVLGEPLLLSRAHRVFANLISTVPFVRCCNDAYNFRRSPGIPQICIFFYPFDFLVAKSPLKESEERGSLRKKCLIDSDVNFFASESDCSLSTLPYMIFCAYLAPLLAAGTLRHVPESSISTGVHRDLSPRRSRAKGEDL